tara:strand:+ start:4288 stop:6117 length:1830 start_codon:yes stop_codon:yes gene_type:complete
MGGGLMQLVAYGAQDVYLTGNPQITFWKVTYRRHTNFAMESIEQTFNGQADFGRRVQCTISRNGDLAYRTYLQVTLPEIGQENCCNTTGCDKVYARWLDYPGEQLISMVEVEIGGQRIDRQYGDWMHIWNQLTLTAEQERGYNKMVGQTTQLTYLIDPLFADVDSACASTEVPAAVCAPRNALPETTLYIPLQFWFCRNPGLALPLIALQYHEVRINLELRPSDEVLFAVNNLTGEQSLAVDQNSAMASTTGKKFVSEGTSVKDAASYQKSLVAASLYVDYIFLDTDERRRMAQNPHEYLIEQLQFTGDESVGSSSNKVKLNFNHPCKELVWVVQPDKNVDYCASFLKGTDLNSALGAQPFNYTDALDALVNTIAAFSGPAGVYLNDEGVAKGNKAFIDGAGFQDAGADSNAYVGIQWGANANEMTWNVPNATAQKQNNYGMANTGTKSASFGSCNVSTQVRAPGMNVPFPIQQIPDSGVSDAGAFVLAETALNMHCWGQNPVVTAKLQLNGQDRFSEREGTYFDLVQPFQHHTRSPDTGINLYSFALRPEEHQPSGTCNMSRIDNATLQLVLSTNAIGGDHTAKVRVYATNYNVLRVMSGMGGLAYSN